MASILVVCSGNICRSPVAEGLLRHALRVRFGNESPLVSSAGTIGLDGSPATPEAVQAAGERGVDIGRHVARRLDDEMLAADLMVCMAAEHREEIQDRVPEALARTFTLKELVRLLELELPTAPLSPQALTERVAAADQARRDGAASNPYDEDVVDPLGMPLETYRAIAWELDEWIHRLVEGLFGPVPAAMEAEGA